MQQSIQNFLLVLGLLLGMLGQPAFSQAQDKNLLKKLTKAQQAFEKHDYSDVEKFCNDILNAPAANVPENDSIVAAAYSLMGRIYEHRLQDNPAYRSQVKSYFERTVKKNPKNTEYLLQLAKFYEGEGNNQTGAINEYEKVIELGRATPEILKKLINYYEQAQQYDKAASHYRRLILLTPIDSNTRYRLGIILQKLGDWDGAKRAFIEATLADDKNWDAYVALGQIYEEQGNYDEALSAYKRAENISGEAKEGVQRATEFIMTRDFISNTVQLTNQALLETNTDQLGQLHYRLDSLQKRYPQNLEIRQKRQEVRQRLCNLWFQEAERLSANEQTLKYAPAAYDLSFNYADSETDRSRALMGKSRAQARIDLVAKTVMEFEGAEKAFKAKVFEEAKKGFIAVGQINPSQRDIIESKQIEIDYFRGLVALQDSFNFEEAKVYFDKVRKQDSRLRQGREFSNLESYFAEASKRLETEKAISFLKVQATTAFDDSLWGKAKVYLEELLPRIDDEISYFNARKDSTSGKNEWAKQKILENRIKELEKDKMDFDRKLQRLNARFGKTDWTKIVLWFAFFFIGILISNLFPYLKRFVERRFFYSEVRENFNPYVVAQPIDAPEMFFGRTSYLARIQGAIKNHSILLYGERRIGKTSILKQLERRLTKPYFVFYSDLENTPPEGFFSRVMRSLYNRVRIDFPTETLELIIAQSSQLYTVDDFQDDFYRVLDLLRHKYDPNVIVVMNLDEGDFLNDYPIEVLRELRRILQEHSLDLRMILAGVYIDTTREDSKSSTLFGFEEKIEVKPLSRKEAADLIRKPVEPFFSYDDDAVEYIIDKSDCKPQFIQKFCRYALSALQDERSRRKRIKRENVVEVFERDILREYADEYDKAWQGLDEDTCIALIDVVQDNVANPPQVAALLRRTLRNNKYVHRNRLIYFENSHVRVFTPFKEWIVKNEIWPRIPTP